jgi:hypothetical protein
VKPSSLQVAAAIVLTANVLALSHAWLNRTGAPDAAVTLTTRELNNANSADTNAGLSFRLLWSSWDPDPESRAWATRRNLEGLGFDLSVPADSPDAADFYRRQQPRRGWAALDLNTDNPSPLRVVDVARDPKALRARHPNTTGTLILPAIIGITALPARRANAVNPATPAEITGHVTELPTRIHVPQPFSAQLRARLYRSRQPDFRLHVTYGQSYEPWVTGVDFPPTHE